MIFMVYHEHDSERLLGKGVQLWQSRGTNRQAVECLRRASVSSTNTKMSTSWLIYLLQHSFLDQGQGSTNLCERRCYNLAIFSAAEHEARDLNRLERDTVSVWPSCRKSVRTFNVFTWGRKSIPNCSTSACRRLILVSRTGRLRMNAGVGRSEIGRLM